MTLTTLPRQGFLVSHKDAKGTKQNLPQLPELLAFVIFVPSWQGFPL